MTKGQLVSILFSGAFFVATGCGDAGGENLFDRDDWKARFEGAAAAPPSGDNGDDAECFWSDDVQEALRTLATDKLKQADGELPSLPDVSASCRHILAAAVKCALPESQSVIDADTGATYKGWWGLAPGWENAALSSTAERRWVTACMLQRVNSFTRPILLEGDHAIIEEDATYDSTYPYEEATVFGDLFSSTNQLHGSDGAPFTAHVCLEDDMVQNCTLGDGWLGLQSRICDTASQCGLVSLGACSSAGTDDAGYWTFPSYGYTETIRLQLNASQATCYE